MKKQGSEFKKRLLVSLAVLSAGAVTTQIISPSVAAAEKTDDELFMEEMSQADELLDKVNIEKLDDENSQANGENTSAEADNTADTDQKETTSDEKQADAKVEASRPIDWKAVQAQDDAQLAALKHLIPDTVKSRLDEEEKALQPGKLSTTQKNYIALAVGLRENSDAAIARYAQNLVNLGVPRQEFADVLAKTIGMGGNLTVPYAGKALDAYDQFKAESKVETKKYQPLTEQQLEFIAIAMASQADCNGCRNYHSQVLKNWGTSREELDEALAVYHMLGGGPAGPRNEKTTHIFDKKAKETLEKKDVKAIEHQAEALKYAKSLGKRTYGYVDWVSLAKQSDTIFKTLQGLAADATNGRLESAKKVFSDGAMSAKDKHFTALALAVRENHDLGIAQHTQALLKLGASRQELADMLAKTIGMGGNLAMSYTGKALDAYETLYRANEKAWKIDQTKPSGLNAKEQELIAIAMAAQANCDTCRNYHSQQLVNAGATLAEVQEALSVYKQVGGGPAGVRAGLTEDVFKTKTAEADKVVSAEQLKADQHKTPKFDADKLTVGQVKRVSSQRDWVRELGLYQHQVENLGGQIPETIKAQIAATKKAFQKDALSVKEKHFIALAVAARENNPGVIAKHVDELLKLGTTQKELASALPTFLGMGGDFMALTSGQVLEAYDALLANNAKAYPQIDQKKAAVLSAKEQELIAIAMATQMECHTCMTYHNNKLLDADATKEEILSALETYHQMGGGPAGPRLQQTVEILDKLIAERKEEGSQPGEEKPGEEKPGEEKPAEDKPGENKPSEVKPDEDKPGEDKPGENKSSASAAKTLPQTGAGTSIALGLLLFSSGAALFRRRQD